jgi:hypothetical protein
MGTSCVYAINKGLTTSFGTIKADGSRLKMARMTRKAGFAELTATCHALPARLDPGAGTTISEECGECVHVAKVELQPQPVTKSKRR